MANEKGFSLFECLIAVGVLAVALGGILALQASSVSTAQITWNLIQGRWALKATLSQIQYVLETRGPLGIPASSSFVWTANPEFQIQVKREEMSDLKPSQFFLSGLKSMSQSTTEGSMDANLDVDKTFGPALSFVDTALTSKIASGSLFQKINVEVQWGKEANERLKSGLIVLQHPPAPAEEEDGKSEDSDSKDSTSTGDQGSSSSDSSAQEGGEE